MKRLAALALILGLASATATAAGPQAASSPQDSDDVSMGLHFELQAGNFAGYFATCTLGTESELVEQRVAPQPNQPAVRMIPGRFKTNNLVCTRGVTANTELWAWRQMVGETATKGPSAARRDGTLIAYDQAMIPVAKWTFTGAWPASVSLDAKEQRTMVETVVLVLDSLRRE